MASCGDPVEVTACRLLEMYAVIDIPDFALQALQRLQRKRLAGPCALIDESGDRSVVVAANREALAAGVRAGMRPVQALARCGGLHLELRSPGAEAQAGRSLLLLARTLSPRVEATEPGRVTADLRGIPEKGLEGRAEALVRRFAGRGLRVRVGISDTPDHACWAALRAAPVRRVSPVESFLEELPVAILGLPEEAAGVLEGWGVRSLADLSRLPRAALGARLGRAGLELRDRVSGRRARPLKLSAPGSCYRRGQEFEHRIETLEALLFILKRFVDELVLELEAGGAAAFELRLELELDDGGILRRRIELPEPSQRGGTLSRVLQSALEDMRTESAIRAVALRLQTAPARSCQGELFAVVMEDAARFGETADRVAAIVGPGRSGSPRVGDSWRPDDFSMENVDTDVDPGKDGADVPDGSGLPFRRLRPPCSLRVMKEGGRPVAVAFTPSARHPALARLPRGAVTCARGPWRSSGGWWESGAWVREEWDVEMAGGGLYRIFRSKEGWFLEGVYG